MTIKDLAIKSFIATYVAAIFATMNPIWFFFAGTKGRVMFLITWAGLVGIAICIREMIKVREMYRDGSDEQ